MESMVLAALKPQTARTMPAPSPTAQPSAAKNRTDITPSTEFSATVSTAPRTMEGSLRFSVSRPTTQDSAARAPGRFRRNSASTTGIVSSFRERHARAA